MDSQQIRIKLDPERGQSPLVLFDDVMDFPTTEVKEKIKGELDQHCEELKLSGKDPEGDSVLASKKTECTHSTHDLLNCLQNDNGVLTPPSPISLPSPPATSTAALNDTDQLPLAKNFRCIYCNYESNYMHNLRRHLRDVHLDLKSFKGKELDIAATEVSQLNIYIKCAPGSQKNYKCDHCDYVTARPAILSTHVLAKHSGLKPFKCEECEYRTAWKGHLMRHVKQGHSNQKCNQCNFKTRKYGNLKEHYRVVHATEKPHKCDFCNYAAVMRGNLNRHVKNIHGGNKYNCTDCDYACSHLSTFKVHIKTKHLT